MFAALYVPSSPVSSRLAERPRTFTPSDPRTFGIEALLGVARDFSPRVEVHAERLVTLDVAGLERLVGPPPTIGAEIRRTAADRRLPIHVAIAARRMAALLLSQSRPGLTVVKPGDERVALAPLPLRWLQQVPGGAGADDLIATLKRWGAKTMGDLAALPSMPLSERLGQAGLVWQRIARGEDLQPLAPTAPEERFEQSLDLEWPIEGLEPLSFVLGRLFEPLSDQLERRDRGVAVLHVRLRLVTREMYARSLQLPSPIRDPRVLRTLALLDLESHPPPAAIDRVAIEAEPTPGRVLQFSLLARALPSAERVSTLLARLTALAGEDRVGSPRLTDSHRPGAFVMTPFMASGELPARTGDGRGSVALPSGLRRALKRFRHPVPARVTLADGRPVRVVSDRRGLAGGMVARCAGPWRTSGDWWQLASPPPAAGALRTLPETGQAEAEPNDARGRVWKSTTSGGFGVRGNAKPVEPAGRRESAPLSGLFVPSSRRPWNRDEWDVGLADGVAYRIFHDRDRDCWFVEGEID
jgi:protein ImuB